jgi:hypothetical protein
MALLLLVAWVLLTPRFNVAFESGYKVTVVFASVVLLGMILQICTYPGMGLSNESVLGLWPSRFTPYTAYASKLTKRQFVATSLMPFVVLSILPLLFAAVLRTNSGWLIFGSCLAAGIYGTNAAACKLRHRGPRIPTILAAITVRPKPFIEWTATGGLRPAAPATRVKWLSGIALNDCPYTGWLYGRSRYPLILT